MPRAPLGPSTGEYRRRVVGTRGWRPRLWPTVVDLGDAAQGSVLTAVGLAVAIGVVGGVSAPGGYYGIPLVAVVVGVADVLLRPVLRLTAGRLGVLGVLVLGTAVQVLLLWGALHLAPGVQVGTWQGVVPVLLVTALVLVVLRWVLGVNDSTYLLADVLGRARSARRGRPAVAGPRARGVVVVQLDGLGEPLLRHAVGAGTLPTVARWLRSGSHELQPWWAQLPSTTPASQAGLLHGSTQAVPAFRWWDKQAGRLVVTNRPRDAALVEQRLSTGEGLLAGGGVSISTLFSGDAATNLAVMSRAAGRGGLGPGGAYLRLVARPFALARALVLTAGEMVKELYQARQQRLRMVEPRVPRRGSYVVLRALTNVLLRDLTTTMAVEHMVRGAPVVYLDLLDYDEVAHHAGVARPESLRALEGMDRVLWLLEQVLPAAAREYEVVLVSDHGQSQGATFEQVVGRSLPDVVEDLVAGGPGSPAMAAGEGEDYSPVNALASEVLGSRSRDGQVVFGPDRRPGAPGPARRGGRRPAPAAPDADGPPAVVTAASGSFASLWFARIPGAVPLEAVEASFPRLVPDLLATGAVGVVVARTADRGPVALGPRGSHALVTGAVEGEDPLRPYGPRARADLLRAVGLDHAGDLLLLSTVSPRTGEVHSFEHHVGSHGGIGGDQNRAVLVHPAGWTVDEDLLDRSLPGESVLVGAEVVHVQLLRWWARLGLRDAGPSVREVPQAAPRGEAPSAGDAQDAAEAPDQLDLPTGTAR